MDEIIKIVLEYAAIWAPSLVAVLGVITAILTAINKTKDQIDKLRSDTDFKAIKEKLEKNASENQELVRCNKLLLDQITRMTNYADTVKNEEE